MAENTGQELIIAEVYDGGASIRMLDGSEWRLSDEDASATATWLPGDAVVVRRLDTPTAMVEIVNDEDVVRAMPR